MLNVFFMISTCLICIFVMIKWQVERKSTGLNKETKSRYEKAEINKIPVLSWLSNERLQIAVFWIITIIAVAVRLWELGKIPYGLSVDEASIGYDAFAIGNYGFDRNGFHLPIYPIGPGQGHGPLLTYLSIPAIRILGLSIFSLRLTNAALSCTAVILSYFLIRRLAGSRSIALIGYWLMSTAPVLIMSSRWALDGCAVPSLFIIALFFFVRAIDTQKTLDYIFAAAFFALICYSYGPVLVVAPVFLVLSCIYLLCHKKLTGLQLGVSAVTFLIVITPLVVFLLRNILGLPAINSFISFPRFNGMRTDTVFSGTLNLLHGLKLIFSQVDHLPWNSVPEFGTTYMFTSPLIVFGLIILLVNIIVSIKTKTYSHIVLLGAYLAGSFLLCALYDETININRISVIYPCIILLILLAVVEIVRRSRYLAAVLCIFVAVSFTMFTADYFGEHYKEYFGDAFFYSLGDALEFAMDKTDGTIYVTETYQNYPSIYPLFYSEMPPEDYYSTVTYYDKNAHVLHAMSYDRFIFGIPVEKDLNAAYIILDVEAEQFINLLPYFDYQVFEYYAVMYPREASAQQ